MSNEILFLFHTLCVVLSVLGAAVLGLEALCGFCVLAAVLANLFVAKQMDIWSLTVTCSDVFMIGNVIALALVQEYWGRKTAQRVVLLSFAAMSFFTAMSVIHISYTPSTHDTTQLAYQCVLGFTPRLCFASAATMIIVQFLEVSIFGRLVSLFGRRLLGLRIIASLLVTQGLDTVLFSFLGLYGLVHSIGSVIFMSYSIKVVLVGSMGYVVGACRSLLDARREQL